MILKVKKEDLLKTVGDIQSISSKKSTMPILGHFLLNVGEEIYVVATDLDTAIKEPLRVEEADGGGQLCVPAKKFYEIIRELGDDITLQTEDSQWLRITSQSASIRLACMSSEDFPKWPELKDPLTIQIPSSQLVEMINRTIYAVGESEMRYTLNSLLFHIKPEGTLTLVGTDGHRLSMIRYPLGEETTETIGSRELKLLIPKKAGTELRRLLADTETTVIRIGSNHLSFESGETTLLVRLVEGNYPDYEQALPFHNEKKAVIDREAFIKVLKRVSVISRERQSAVKIDFRDGVMIVSASSVDLGEATDELAVNYEGDDISIGFNARYLLEALSSMETGRVRLTMQEPLSATLLTPEGDDRYLCVIMPMRL